MGEFDCFATLTADHALLIWAGYCPPLGVHPGYHGRNSFADLGCCRRRLRRIRPGGRAVVDRPVRLLQRPVPEEIAAQVAAINALEPKYQAMTDAELREQTVKFRKRLAGGETLDDLLVEAFAVCREAGRRDLGMRHFDVQLMGGMVLHRGTIAEMVTGEGKTLVATLPAYLNALEGKGVHVVTVNDYLARRDMEWMGPLYMSLGLTVGTIQSQMDDRRAAASYECDITYGTNNEFGFDYLRDNMRPAARGDDRYPTSRTSRCRGRCTTRSSTRWTTS